jgi:hypothetical protein
VAAAKFAAATDIVDTYEEGLLATVRHVGRIIWIRLKVRVNGKEGVVTELLNGKSRPGNR